MTESFDRGTILQKYSDLMIDESKSDGGIPSKEPFVLHPQHCQCIKKSIRLCNTILLKIASVKTTFAGSYNAFFFNSPSLIIKPRY